MKKYIFLVLLMCAIVFLAGCEDVPPPPGSSPDSPVGQVIYYGETEKVPDNFAYPWDSFQPVDNMILQALPIDVNLVSDSDSEIMTVIVDHPDGYIFNKGYVYTNDGWKILEFPGDTVMGSSWIKDYAEVELNLTLDEYPAGENYILAYSCKKHDDEWKCGCRETDNCGYWMLQTFDINTARNDVSVTDVVMDPELPEVGDVVSIEASLKNLGNIPADLSGSTVTLKIKNNAISFEETRDITIPADTAPIPGEEVTVTLVDDEALFTTAGYYTLDVTLNYDDEKSGNNIASNLYQVLEEGSSSTSTTSSTVSSTSSTTSTTVDIGSSAEEWPEACNLGSVLDAMAAAKGIDTSDKLVVCAQLDGIGTNTMAVCCDPLGGDN